MREHRLCLLCATISPHTLATGKRCDAEGDEREQRVYRRHENEKLSERRTETERERRHERTNEAVPAREWELCDVREDSMSRDDERDAFALRSRSRRAATRGIVVGRRKSNDTKKKKTLKCAKSCAEKTLCTCPCPKCFQCEKNRGNRTGRS